MDARQVTRVAAYGLVLQSDAILLCRIGTDLVSRNMGRWTLPGGGMEFGEHPIQAMIREVREETGLIVEANGLAGVDSICVEVEGVRHHSIRIIYHTTIVGGELTNEVDGSTDMCEWCPVEHLDQRELIDLAQTGIGLAFPSI